MRKERTSGPLLDRIDLQIEVPAVPFKELSAKTPGTTSSQMREQVLVARQLQQDRFAGHHTNYNAKMSSREIRNFCKLDDECMNLLKASINEMGLSARAHDKILRVARTIADLDESLDIQVQHIHEPSTTACSIDKCGRDWRCKLDPTLRYNVIMSTNHVNNIEQVVAEQHGGPVHLQGTNVVAMSIDVYREMMGVGTDQELEESLAAIGRGWQAVQEGRTRPFRDALDDLGRRYEAQS